METPETGGSSAAPPIRLQRWIGLTFLAVSILLIAVMATSLWVRREVALREGHERAKALAFILGDHLQRNVGAVDATVSQVALAMGRLGGPNVRPDILDPVLAAARSTVSGIANISIVNEAGVITHATLPELIGQSRADTHFFQELSRTPGGGLVVDRPRRGRLTGQTIIPFARSVTDPQGRFIGAVVASFEPERLRGFYRTIAVGRQGVIWLATPDGTVLFREPSSGVVEAANEPGWIEQATSAPNRDFFRAPFTAGGPTFFHVLARVKEPPLIIAASIPERIMLMGWTVDAFITLAAAAGFLALLLLAWVLIVRVIRQRANAEEALRANQVMFQSIMDHAPIMLSLRDLNGRFTFINRTYVAFAGQSEASIIGRTMAELRGADLATAAAEQDRFVIENRKSAQWEMTLAKPNGPRNVLITKFPVYDAAGNVNSLGTIVTDITDQKRAEIQLAQAQRMNAIGQLTGGIAHDFNNLLTSLLLNADVLVRHIDDDRLRPAAEAIRMAAERGADLIRRLLAFGRRQMLEPRPTDIKELLDGMEPLMRRTLGEHIDLEFVHAPDLWTANVDPNQLENAVLNLAVNARDAMPDGGKLTIETANATFDADDMALNPEMTPGEYVMIAVRDSGTGMSPDLVARAFEPFFTTKEVGKGTGLGLSMVYGFVRQSGGHVRIYSEVGLGTVVRLYVPHSDVAPLPLAIASPGVAEPASSAETILFVEDDPLVRKHTQDQLAELGYRVVTAENGPAALAQVEEGCTPDLLFTDLVMPGGINGHELARRLRRRWPDLPVLYCSGYAHDALAPDGETVPARNMLAKPYRRRELAAKLRELLDAPLAVGE
jgi:PAS domain S-box-containing protein